jgi:hypothetical protein
MKASNGGRWLLCCVAVVLSACATSPKDELELSGSMAQSQVFSGYVPLPGSVKLQIREWTNNCHGLVHCTCTPGAWRDIDTLTTSTNASDVVVDECGERWHPYSKSISLPNDRKYWCFNAQNRAYWQEWRLNMGGVILASFTDEASCSPSRKCGSTVASECGNADGIIRLYCAIHGGVCTESFR